jgi:hypothetical protein
MTAEDLVQETAAIVLTKAPPMATDEDLYRWSLAVARHLHIDSVRKRKRVTTVAVPDRPDAADVEHAVVQRLRLSAIADALTRLSTAERAALTAEAPIDADRRARVRTNVRRLRARARLLQLAGPRGLAGLGPIATLRRVLQRADRWVVPAAAAAVVVPVVVGLGPWLGGRDGTTPARPLVTPQLSVVVPVGPVKGATLESKVANGSAPLPPDPAITSRVFEPVTGQRLSVTREPIAEDDPRRHTLTVCTGAGDVPVLGPYADICVEAPTFVL